MELSLIKGGIFLILAVTTFIYFVYLMLAYSGHDAQLQKNLRWCFWPLIACWCGWLGFVVFY